MSLVFTKQADVWIGRVTVGVFLLTGLGIAGLYYYGPPEYTRVGYAPMQPVAFSHAQHVGQLGMSCLFCHTNVEESPHANIPPTQTCITCHSLIKPDSPKLALVQASWKSGNPIPWERVHKTPDYVYFNHAVHVRRGIGCESCHGKINEMPVVVARPVAEHGMVPGVPPPSRESSEAGQRSDQDGVEPARGAVSARIRRVLEE